MKKFGSVDEFVDRLENWQPEVIRLRNVVGSMGLEETLKWSMPVFVHHKKNVVGIFATKSYFGLWFYQGALISDPENLLINAQEGKTKALRQWRMTSKKEIRVRPIKKYILEAIKLVESGLEIKPARNKPLEIPIELQEALNKNHQAKSAFAEFNKTRQREFADHIFEAKKPVTKLRRLEKILPMIESGVGLNDKYRR